MPARCPRSRIKSGFISDLGLLTFGPSTLHFQHFSVLEFQLLPRRVGQILVQVESFPKKVSVPTYSAFACALKARGMRSFKVQVGSLKRRGGGRRGRRMEGGEEEADLFWSTIRDP